MIKWCAYCQKFIGEKKPFTSYDVTHTICKSCFAKVKDNSFHSIDIDPIRNFIRELVETPVIELMRNNKKIIQKAEDLKLDPLSLFFGILTPVMQKVGDLVAQKKLSITEEHIYSTIVEKLISELELNYMQDPELLRAKNRVLLTNVDSNYHSIGLRILWLGLRFQEINAEIIYPSLPAEALIEHLKNYPAQVVCLSVATQMQLDSAKEMIHAIKTAKLPLSPKLAIGGNITRLENNLNFNVDFINNVEDINLFFNFLKQNIAQ
jgi:methanogenic corrinoid protein MtbC1